MYVCIMSITVIGQKCGQLQCHFYVSNTFLFMTSGVSELTENNKTIRLKF